MVRLTDRLDMTLDVYRGCKTTIQQQQQFLVVSVGLGVGQDVSMLLTNTCTCTSANWSTLIPGTCTLQYKFLTYLAKEYSLKGSHIELCLLLIGFTCPIIFPWISAPWPLT